MSTNSKGLAPVYVDELTVDVVTEDASRLPRIGNEVQMAFPWTGGAMEWFAVAAVKYERSWVERGGEGSEVAPSGWIYKGTLTLAPQTDEDPVAASTSASSGGAAEPSEAAIEAFIFAAMEQSAVDPLDFSAQGRADAVRAGLQAAYAIALGAAPSPAEPTDKAKLAAYRALWGNDPVSDSPHEVMCPRDTERWAETVAMLRAAYTIDGRAAAPADDALREARQLAALLLVESGRVPDPRFADLRDVDIREVFNRPARTEPWPDPMPLTDVQVAAIWSAYQRVLASRAPAGREDQ